MPSPKMLMYHTVKYGSNPAFFQWNTSLQGQVLGQWGPSLLDDSRINDHVNRTLHLRPVQKSSQLHPIKPYGSHPPSSILNVNKLESSARPLIGSLDEFE